LHPGPELTQPSILSWSVKWVPATAGKVLGRYVRRCLVRAMYTRTWDPLWWHC